MTLDFIVQNIVLSLVVAFVVGLILGYIVGRVQKERFKSVKGCNGSTNTVKNKFKMNPIFNKNVSLDHKPMVLSSSNKKDNLKKIKGIDEELEDKLYELGIFHFYQIAEWSSKNLEWVENFLVLPDYIQEHQWIAQAKILKTGNETNYSKKLLDESLEETLDENNQEIEKN